MEVTNNPLPGTGEAFAQAIDSVAYYPEWSDAAQNVLVFLNTIVNMMIPILITAMVVGFLGYLVGYIFVSGAKRQEYVGGATRSAIALFCMMNIWTFVRVAQEVMGVGLLAGYFIMIAAFVLLGAWNIFSLGTMVMTLIAWLSARALDAFVVAARQGSEAARKKEVHISAEVFRLLVLVAVLLFISFVLAMLVS